MDGSMDGWIEVFGLGGRKHSSTLRMRKKLRVLFLLP